MRWARRSGGRSSIAALVGHIGVDRDHRRRKRAPALGASDARLSRAVQRAGGADDIGARMRIRRLRRRAAIGGRVVLKIASDDIAHKSDIGGVALNLQGDDAVAEAFRRIMTVAPAGARVDGVLVAPMRSGGLELFVGCTRDPQWGPVIAVGLGGVWVEVLQDVALRPLPIDAAEVRRMLAELRGAKLLHGVRGMPAADLDAVADGDRAHRRCGSGARTRPGGAGSEPAMGARLGCGSVGRAGGLAGDMSRRSGMDLSLSDKHRALQDEVRAFIREHGHKSPKLGGGRKRPDQKALDWQKLLVDHGYVARTIPREYGGFGAEPDVLEAAVIAAEFAAAGHLCRHDQPGHQHAGADPAGGRHRGAEEAMDREDHPRRRHLVPGLFGARRGQRPRVAADARRVAGRALRRSTARRSGPARRTTPT